MCAKYLSISALLANAMSKLPPKIIRLTQPKSLDSGLYPISKLERDLKYMSPGIWEQRGAERIVQLFKQMSRRVPAYKKVLAEHGIDPAKIKTIEDIEQLPTLDKDNYLRKYPLSELCWDGKFAEKSWVISATSGSTGQPYYFPRQDSQDYQYALTAELYLRSNFQIHKRKTLYVNAFAMGVWIGGLFTYEAIKTVAEKGEYSLSIISPGINKAEVINAINSLGKNFDQVIIGSYPPILKDIVDDGIEAGLDWKEYNLGVIFSAEGFTEEFRDYIIEHAALPDPLTSTLNHYGTVDLGTMAHETPLSILIRKLALKNGALYESLFGSTTKLPTLAQFIPEMFYFESQNGKIYCSAHSGLPLIRYDLKDNGGVIPMESIMHIFEQHDMDLLAEAKKAGIEDTLWNLPFVYVYERSDFAVTFLGFQVYPEPIRKSLQDKHLMKVLTGKFTLTVEYDKQQEQQLKVHAELKAGVSESKELKRQVTEAITAALIRDNPIYKMNHDELKERVLPRVSFWPYEDKTYFAVGGKQKWVKK